MEAEIKKALEALGYKSGTRIRYREIAVNRAVIYIDAERVGIYDAHRATFVD